MSAFTWRVILLPPIHRSLLHLLCAAQVPSGFHGWSWLWNSTKTERRERMMSSRVQGTDPPCIHLVETAESLLENSHGLDFYQTFALYAYSDILRGWFNTMGLWKPCSPTAAVGTSLIPRRKRYKTWRLDGATAKYSTYVTVRYLFPSNSGQCKLLVAADSGLFFSWVD